MRNLTLADINNGAIIDIANAEMQSIANDINDINKKADSPRELVIKVKFMPNKDAKGGAVIATVSSSLGKRREIEGSVYFGEMDGKGLMSERFLPSLDFEAKGEQ